MGHQLFWAPVLQPQDMREDERVQPDSERAQIDENDRTHIERLIRDFVTLVNARDFDALRGFHSFADTWASEFEYRSSSEDTLEDHINAFEEHCKSPEYTHRRIRIRDITTSFTLRDGEKQASAMLMAP